MASLKSPLSIIFLKNSISLLYDMYRIYFSEKVPLFLAQK